LKSLTGFRPAIRGFVAKYASEKGIETLLADLI
jgi:hypothetical protein